MKWLAIIISLVFYLPSKAQVLQKYKVKITFADSTWTSRVPGPFSDFKKGRFIHLDLNDTTAFFKIAANESSEPLEPLYPKFTILNRSKNNLKLIILSIDHNLYRQFSFQNGFMYAYLVDLSEGKLNIYRCWSLYIDRQARKHIEIDIDAISDRDLVLTGDYNKLD